ncbi:MAG: ferrous iron transport protein B [Euryarchaeota archaeon]|nr:ferrous iron transport protein B [Euryarchaeota archaeon]
MHGRSRDRPKTGRRYALVGNPNVGKSVIFGALTGRYVVVSNYPGTTVEVSRGRAGFDRDSELIDTPGINNLIPMSEDEVVTRDILLQEKMDAVIQVIDAKNLRRGLLITLQLAEMGLPLVVDLNMVDEAGARGITTDADALAETLGVPVVETIATQRRGIGGLVKAIAGARPSDFTVRYDEDLEEAVGEVAGLLPETNISKRSLALMLLAGDASLAPWVERNLGEEEVAAIREVRHRLEAHYREALSSVITNYRLVAAEAIVMKVQRQMHVEKRPLAEKLGALAMHPIYGIPVLLGVLFALYLFVGVFGAGTLVDFFQGTVFEGHIGPAAVGLFDRLLPFPHIHHPVPTSPYNYEVTASLSTLQEGFRFVHDLFVGQYGMITVALSYSIAIVFPIVTTFFIAFGILEDSGYLPRLGVMTNSAFTRIGLNGRAVLPMVLGLGCGTMATLTARILETRKERVIVTLLLALGVPCSAQLGVILGILGPLPFTATLIWAGVILCVLLLVGYLASKVVTGDGEACFLMELPPMRLPQLTNIAVKTIARIEWYLKEAVPLFILGTLVLFTLDRLHALAALENLARPVVVGLLDLPPETTGAFLIGFLRRDYGAAGLFALASRGLMDPVQSLVSLVTITLFVPCIANFFMIVKERGAKTAIYMVAFIFPFAFLVGGTLNLILRTLEVGL